MWVYSKVTPNLREDGGTVSLPQTQCKASVSLYHFHALLYSRVFNIFLPPLNVNSRATHRIIPLLQVQRLVDIRLLYLTKTVYEKWQYLGIHIIKQLTPRRVDRFYGKLISTQVKRSFRHICNKVTTTRVVEQCKVGTLIMYPSSQLFAQWSVNWANSTTCCSMRHTETRLIQNGVLRLATYWMFHKSFTGMLPPHPKHTQKSKSHKCPFWLQDLHPKHKTCVTNTFSTL